MKFTNVKITRVNRTKARFNCKQVVVTGLLCLGLVACGSDDDNSTNMDGDLPEVMDTGSDSSSLAPGETPAESVSVFDGTWVSNCSQELSLIGVSEYQRITLEVNAEVYTRTINSYRDSDCSVASSPAVAISEHSMQFPEGEVSTSQGAAQFVDVTMESIEVDGVDASGLQQTVGIDTEYNIYVVGADGRLYFGVPSATAAERPTELYTTLYFEAQ